MAALHSFRHGWEELMAVIHPPAGTDSGSGRPAAIGWNHYPRYRLTGHRFLRPAYPNVFWCAKRALRDLRVLVAAMGLISAGQSHGTSPRQLAVQASAASEWVRHGAPVHVCLVSWPMQARGVREALRSLDLESLAGDQLPRSLLVWPTTSALAQGQSMKESPARL